MKSEHFSFFLLIWTVPSSFPKTFEVTSIGSDAVKHEHDSRSFRQFTELLPLKNRASPLESTKSQKNGGFGNQSDGFGLYISASRRTSEDEPPIRRRLRSLSLRHGKNGFEVDFGVKRHEKRQPVKTA